MKHTIIFSAFAFILASATLGSAQISSLRVSFSESVDTAGGGQGAGKVIVQDNHFNPNLRVFEALIPARSVEQCFASTDFSNARPVGTDRASLTYDTATSSYHLTWFIGKENKDSCRVILVGETVAEARYNVWRANFGRTAFADGNFLKDEAIGARTGDGSVRFISHQVDVSAWY